MSLQFMILKQINTETSIGELAQKASVIKMNLITFID